MYVCVCVCSIVVMTYKLLCVWCVQAVTQFYIQGFLHQDAHRWLSAAQFSSAAWSFSWELIQPSKVPLILSCFLN